MTRFAMIHNASRFDRSRASLRTSVRGSLARDAVSVMGFTEVAGAGRRATLGKVLARHGWDLLQRGPDQRLGWPLGETALAADGEVWDVVRWRSVKIGPDLGPGDIVVCTIALLRHRRTGETVLVGDAHLPASVEGDWSSARAAAYRLCVQRYRRLVRAWTAAFDPDAIVIFADWNLCAHKAWVRAYIAEAWPELRLVRPEPRDRTHRGGRFIDWCLVAGFRDAELRGLPADPSSDHCRALFTGVIRAA